MANHELSRLLRLARRTGDRLIVTDDSGRDPLVILGLDDYEALIDGAFGPSELPVTHMAEDVRGPSVWGAGEVASEDVVIDDGPGEMSSHDAEHEMASDEVDVDLEALSPLWEPAGEAPVSRALQEGKSVENIKKNSGDNEEDFYLEDIE